MSDTDRPSPSTQSIIDQSEAALHDMETALRLLAARDGDEISETYRPGPRLAAALQTAWAKMVDAMGHGRGVCPHLHPGRPQPTWWPLWAPGKLRCTACFQANVRSIAGTVEDRRCDVCGVVTDREIFNCSMLFDATILEIVAGAHLATGVQPAIACVYGLCADCRVEQP